MPSGIVPRVVVVTRPTDFDLMILRHGTVEQARFFLRTREQSIDEIAERHLQSEKALQIVSQAIPARWRRSRVERSDFSRFVFEPNDLVVAVGQDGLVANVAKYLEGQPVIGVNPDPKRYDGVLVLHAPETVAELLRLAAQQRARVESRLLVQAELDDGQRLRALNEIFIGHRSHQSARYRLRWNQREEHQSSSGLVVTTGTGATGWARSIHLHRQTEVALPAVNAQQLTFFVREAFPSVSTGTSVSEGTLEPGASLEVVSEMNDGGTLFGDGIEDDRIDFSWGMRARISADTQPLTLVRG